VKCKHLSKYRSRRTAAFSFDRTRMRTRGVE
jgi:hypothetical protein